MTTSPSTDSLRVHNRTGLRARLGFRYGGLPAWSVWIGAGDSIRVPRLRADRIAASATFTDPLTQVAYTTTAHIDTTPARVVACVVSAADASGFQLGQEAVGRRDHLGVLNLTAAPLQVTLQCAGTPFRLAACVAAQGEQVLDLGRPDLSVTLDGVTSPPIAIAQWASEVTIGVAGQDGQRVPVIHVAPPETQPWRDATPLFQGNHHER